MAQIIDLSSRITNELPMIKLSDEVVFTVDNRKNTVLSVKLMIQEMERKAQKNIEAGKDADFDEPTLMKKVLEIVLSPANAKIIEDMNLPLPEYKLIYQAVMAAMQGKSLEELEADGSMPL